ncbi:MAG TPA: ABC transporter permease [Pirellulales bacterium]|nr:ABC transporter permease [Pirellulales bacterium]
MRDSGLKSAAPSFGSLRRVMGLVRKESLQIARDPSSYLIAGLLPLVLLFLFGYGVSLDLRRVEVGLVVEQATPETESLVAAFRNSPYFRVHLARHRQPFEDDLVAGRLKGVVVLASDFGDRLGAGETAPVQVIVDGSEPNTAGLVTFYVQGVWGTWVGEEALSRTGLAVRNVTPPISVEQRYWFNPELRSHNFLIPGSIAIIMSLIGTLLTALVVAREWERGTMEALMATPITRLEFLLGKLLPYFVMGMAAMGLAATAAVLLFDVPFRGSVLALVVVSAAFLLAMLPLGLLISTLTRNQFAASQAALISAFLPAFELSGFIFEIDSMPWVIRTITHVLPARYFVPCLQTLFLAGDVPQVLVPNTLALLAFATLLFGLLVRSTRLRLE